MESSESDTAYLDELRRLLPNPPRKLRHSEPTQIAERQATLLLDHFGVTEPPVPIVELAERLGIAVLWHPDLEDLGLHAYLDGGWYIFHRDDVLAPRNRTVAHHLKRILDHPHASMLYRSHEVMPRPWRQQYVSEWFAACLIMPSDWVYRLWHDGVRDIEELAALFEVAPEAIALRLEALELIDPDDALPTVVA